MKHFLLALSFITIACAQKSTIDNNNLNEVGIAKVVSKKEFAKIITKKDVQLIDVRTPEEYNEGNIKNAKNINFFDANFKSQLTLLNKKLPVAVYCRSGGRSGRATRILKEMGFTEIYDLKDGYNIWDKNN